MRSTTSRSGTSLAATTPQIPHTIRKRYAVVSCHVEQPLSSAVWERFEALQLRRPGGFPVAALMRPPDPQTDEKTQEERWLERARAAATRGAFGLHTHWTAPDHARPSEGLPSERVTGELAWLRERGLEPTLFCGGGWYSDFGVALVVSRDGVVDCTPTRFVPTYLAADAPRLELAQPATIVLPDGAELTALPTTRSLGMLARAFLRPWTLSEPVLHVYCHDTDLVDPRRRRALTMALTLLGRLRKPLDLSAFRASSAALPRVRFEDCARPKPSSTKPPGV